MQNLDTRSASPLSVAVGTATNLLQAKEKATEEESGVN